MEIPFLLSPFFIEFILPFVLVFTIVFAMLQKTQLFGEDKRQIDVLIGLVVGLILLAFPTARNIIILLTPFLAIAVVILLVFMLLYGFITGKKGVDVLNQGWKIALVALLALALVAYIILITGYSDKIYLLFFGPSSGPIVSMIIMIIAIAAVIVAVVKGEKGT